MILTRVDLIERRSSGRRFCQPVKMMRIVFDNEISPDQALTNDILKCEDFELLWKFRLD